MRGLGTIINVAGILAGGILGCFIKGRLNDSIRETLMTMTGVCVMFLGIGGTMEQMLSVSGGRLSSGGTLMMTLCLAGGAVIGELLRMEEKITRFGSWLKIKSHSTGDSSFVNGFVSTSCTVCIGAMAVIGSLQDGIGGDISVLTAKTILDAIVLCVMSASLGKGCIFSAIPVALVQGFFTLLGFCIGDVLSAAALNNLSFTGSILIFCVGLNLIREKQIRIANVLPALVLAILWGQFS